MTVVFGTRHTQQQRWLITCFYQQHYATPVSLQYHLLPSFVLQ
jgi:hypothetical protein